MANHDDIYHITPFKTYLNIFLILVGLTVLTVVTAQIDFGFLNTPIAFFIATIKAALVVLYFMHIKYDTPMNRAILASGFIFLCILFIIVAIDVATRAPIESVL